MNWPLAARLSWLAACLLALSMTGASSAQSTSDARADGKATGRDLLDDARAAAARPVDAARLPQFDPASVEALEDLADDPDAIGSAAANAATSHEGYRALQDSRARRARFAPAEIEAVIVRAGAISADPLGYTSGMMIGGAQGQCVELPPASVSPGTYTATCNTGVSGSLTNTSCTAHLEAFTTTTGTYDYYCLPGDAPDTGKWWCQNYQTGSCSLVMSAFIPCSDLSSILGIGCGQQFAQVDLYRCDSPIGSFPPDASTGTSTVDTRLNESQCLPLAQNTLCTRQAEVCTDASPKIRTVNGVSLTRDCWAWRRDYQCLETVPGNDCGPLESNPECQFVVEQCLTDERPCPTSERVYTCALPPENTGEKQYVCDGDVYCIDGSCETIERRANDEFKDAVVALNAMNQARREFDPASLHLFTGTRETCSSKVFGVLNCCKGKGFPLVPGVSLLVSLGCSAAEVQLHERDAQGLCAYVGTYCSDSAFGVCLTRKKVYCCFASKLSRILQEQGRQQLPKPWDKPKLEQCEGFTLEEFSRLDLSRMDFSEIYAEFTAAARLPDELATSIDLQQKIEQFYARSAP